MKPNDSSRYCGPKTSESSRSGVKNVRKGRRGITVVATERGSDEDTEYTSRVAKILIDSYMKRPSLKDEALTGMASFANNGIFVHHSKPGEGVQVDAAALFILDKTARWLISGNSRVFHFENGSFVRASDPADAPVFGSSPSYKARIEPGFELKENENAFLVCSRTLADAVPIREMEEALKASQTADEWMQALVQKAGDKQFCAEAVFLPPQKNRIPLPVLIGGALAVIAGIVAFFLLRR